MISIERVRMSFMAAVQAFALLALHLYLVFCCNVLCQIKENDVVFVS